MNKVIELSSKEISSVSGGKDGIVEIPVIAFVPLVTIAFYGIYKFCCDFYYLYKYTDSSPSKKANEIP